MTATERAAEPGEREGRRRYATRRAAIYYLLVLPSVVLESVFLLAVSSTPGDILTQAYPAGTPVAYAVQFLPWAILAASVYAVFSFRLSLLVTLLTASFLLAVTVAAGIFFLGVEIGLEESALLVMAAAFLALAGFGQARGLKLGGPRPEVRSSGPLAYNVFGVAVEFCVPLVAAFALVLLVQAVMGGLGAQAARLPSPLSGLATLYLQTRIGLVLTTLFVAGAAIWVIRQLLEPLVLHLTLGPADARLELLGEIQPTIKSVAKVTRYRPSGGFAWGFLAVAYCVGLAAAILIFLPREALLRDLTAIVKLQPPSPTPLEALLENRIQAAIVRANILFAQSQDLLRQIIALLWG